MPVPPDPPKPPDDDLESTRVTVIDVARRERDRESSAPAVPDALSTARGDDWQGRLADVMVARNLSGGELARRAGFTSQYVNSLRSGDRGARLPLDTARKLAHALGVSVDWLTKGEGPRERLSDVFVVGQSGASGPTSSFRAPAPSDVFPSRAEAIALLSSVVEPEVIDALRAVVPDGGADPGREYWIAYAKDLARDLRRIKADPDLTGESAPKSAYVPTLKKNRP